MRLFPILLAGLVLVAVTVGPSVAADPSHSNPSPSATVVAAPQQEASQTASAVTVAKAERWWRIHLYELDHGRWRSAGTFENPDRNRCIRYGEAWNEGKRGYRRYTAPVAFLR
jgi:hypothetical protein